MVLLFSAIRFKKLYIFSLHDFQWIMADKNGLLETAKGGFFRKKNPYYRK